MSGEGVFSFSFSFCIYIHIVLLGRIESKHFQTVSLLVFFCLSLEFPYSIEAKDKQKQQALEKRMGNLLFPDKRESS